MNGLWKGTLLGALNVFVIAIGMAGVEGHANIAMLVILFGGLPGVLAGAGLGALSSVMSTSPPAIRIAVLTMPALGVVFGLAREFGMQDLALVSSIPTVVAALMLEKWTRHVEAPPVPVARAMSGLYRSSPRPSVSENPIVL
ncbi:MAG: hypothetical protein IPQ07_36455 [Myxococcales bacterium]|nr:hypothetical protein [Myxococcales bacterium]